MFKVEAVATVYYTCSLSDEDGQKVLNYIKENPEEFEFISNEKKILKAVEKLSDDCEIELYDDSAESDFSTDELRWSEFEDKTAEEILRQGGISYDN